MLDGSAIAAILTGILALGGALATAWMSGWNEQRLESRKNRKALARYSVPLLIASWDLANWLYDILEDDFYSPSRCKSYGDGWNSQFTSYLFGQYFAAVYIIREMTHFFAHIKGKRTDLLKKLLWKIQDEFISMHYDHRENLELRWFEGDILAVQEQMTISCDLDGDGTSGELQTMGWVDFQKNYATKDPKSKDDQSKELNKIFGWYEDDIQRIIYRRFKYLYSTEWEGHENPQGFEKMQANLIDKMKKGLADEVKIEDLTREEDQIKKERQNDPNVVVVVPDHRVRRLQHLLVDLVNLLDEVSGMDFNRPVRRCRMLIDRRTLAFGTTDASAYRVPCDCSFFDCNPDKEDFEHRDLTLQSGRKGPVKRKTFTHSSPQTVGPGNSHIRSDNPKQDKSEQC